tara:strand:+ start:165 stop:515 length:351 start_codon:yes stop_codon:yes gene_type:complete
MQLRDQYVTQYAPSLRDEWLMLQPFNDVIDSYSCGPQPGAYDYDPDEPQYIELDFSVWKDGECILPRSFKITKAGVTYEDIDSSCQSSMRELWEYLRSIPRQPHHFVANHYSQTPD